MAKKPNTIFKSLVEEGTEGIGDISIVVYGDPGTFKTIFASTFPEPLIFLDTDSGMRSIQSYAPSRGKKIERVTMLRDSPYEEFNEAFRAIGERVVAGEFRTFVWDSLTTSSDIIMNFVMRINQGVKKDSGIDAQSMRERKSPTWTEYERQKDILLMHMMVSLKWPCNKVYVCHEDIRKDDLLGYIHVAPSLTGNLRQKIAVYVDEVYHSIREVDKKGKPEFWMETAATKRTISKSRLGLTETVEPSYDAIVELYQEKHDGENERQS